MKTFRETALEDYRLVVLRLLMEASGYTGNAHVLGRQLEANGHRESAATLRTTLNYLSEQGALVLVDEPPLLVATLTELGLDGARGRTKIAGVARPAPG